LNHKPTDRQTNKQTDRQRERDRQTDRRLESLSRLRRESLLPLTVSCSLNGLFNAATHQACTVIFIRRVQGCEVGGDSDSGP